MPLEIITYPHPTLRHVSQSIQRVDGELKQIIREMFELMYSANGVGLAANQVDLPFRLFVMNLAANPDEGEELAFINPVISRPRGNEEREEGCLSIPGVYAPVVRPSKIHFNAYKLDGTEVDEEVDGMMARVIQHETDHLDGVLFIDRLSATAKLETEAELHEFEDEFNLMRSRYPTDSEISQRLKTLETKYC